MGVNISGRSFLKLLDFSTQEIEYLLALSRNLKDLSIEVWSNDEFSTCRKCGFCILGVKNSADANVGAVLELRH